MRTWGTIIRAVTLGALSLLLGAVSCGDLAPVQPTPNARVCLPVLPRDQREATVSPSTTGPPPPITAVITVTSPVILTSTPTPTSLPAPTPTPTSSPTQTPTPTPTQWGARPGDYTNYLFYTGGPFYNLDNYAMWEEVPAFGYIFPAFQFFFQANEGGYMGMQLVGQEKKAIFSIWDIAEGSAQPAAPWCDRFGGEGTGARCLILYDWMPGREYRLRLWELDTDPNGEYWVGAIQDTVTGQETQIGTIYLLDSADYTGYGWLRNDAYTFLEYFWGPDGCEGHPYSLVRWRGPYADADQYTADWAIVPAYPNCTHNNVTSAGQPYVTHEAGGETMQTTPPGTELWDVPR